MSKPRSREFEQALEGALGLILVIVLAVLILVSR